jgi:MarR family transcriptional regulator, organic hydroperoxide resistance regulator
VKQSFFQQEIKQTKPFHSLRAEAGVGLLNVADDLRRSFAAVVKKKGVSPQQYNILGILRGAGKDGLATRELAARLIEKWPGVTRFLDQLESRGLIERQRSTEDRRRVLCRITRAGLALLEILDRPVREWEEWSLRMLKEKELQQLLQFLESIRSGDAGTVGVQRDNP